MKGKIFNAQEEKKCYWKKERISILKMLLLLPLLFLSSCGDDRPPEGYDCKRDGFGYCIDRWGYSKLICDVKNRAKFIIDCAKAANPMSDEEGEDLVRQCEETSEHLFCKKVYWEGK